MQVGGDIGSMDDLSQAQQTRVGQFVLCDDRFEGTFATVMSELNPGRIERDRSRFGGSLLNLILGYEEEFGVRVNESADEPGTSDSVDMYVRSSYPQHVFNSHQVVTRASFQVSVSLAS
jgi:hypothetical protein